MTPTVESREPRNDRRASAELTNDNLLDAETRVASSITGLTSSHHVTPRFFHTAFFCFQTFLPEVHVNQCTIVACDRNERSRPRSTSGRVQLHTHPKTKIQQARFSTTRTIRAHNQPLIRISLQFHHKNVRSVETETLLGITFITDHLVKEMCFTEPICRRKRSIGDNNASVVYIPTRLRRLSGVGAGDE